MSAYSVSGRALSQTSEIISIGGDKDEILDVISEISELCQRMHYATPNRVFVLMMQQKIYIDQLTGYLQRLPDGLELQPIPEEAPGPDVEM